MSQAVRFQEILRRLAIIDEGFVEGHAGLGLGLPASRLLDPKTAALVRLGALVTIGSSTRWPRPPSHVRNGRDPAMVRPTCRTAGLHLRARPL